MSADKRAQVVFFKLNLIKLLTLLNIKHSARSIFHTNERALHQFAFKLLSFAPTPAVVLCTTEQTHGAYLHRDQVRPDAKLFYDRSSTLVRPKYGFTSVCVSSLSAPSSPLKRLLCVALRRAPLVSESGFLSRRYDATDIKRIWMNVSLHRQTGRQQKGRDELRGRLVGGWMDVPLSCLHVDNISLLLWRLVQVMFTYNHRGRKIKFGFISTFLWSAQMFPYTPTNIWSTIPNPDTSYQKGN